MLPKPKLNVLLITADQWRGECLSGLGHPCVKTPHLDALIADGVGFRNHYSVCAPCGPSRTSLLTGMYMQNHRSVMNGTPLDQRHTNIALELNNAGYDPVLFGYTDTSLDPRHTPPELFSLHGYEGVLPGFTPECLLIRDLDPWIDDLKAKGYHIPEGRHEIFKPIAGYPNSDDRGRTFPPPVFEADDSMTAFLTRRVTDYLSGRNEPWFVHVSYLRPHPPFSAPEPYNAMYDPDDVPRPVRASSAEEQARLHPWLASALFSYGDWHDPWMQSSMGSEDYDRDVLQVRATYYGLITKVDTAIGRLIALLKETGAYDNTLIVFTSDHGELLGDRWLFGKRGFYDEGYYIPLIIRDPSVEADGCRGLIEDKFTESVDVMPTILDWLGLDIPRQCDGASLLPFCRGARPAHWRTEVHWEYDFRDVGDSRVEQALGIGMDQCTLNVIMDHRYKYVHFTALPPLFFDRRDDPDETRNLAQDPDHAPRMNDYASKLLSWRMQNDERTLTGLKVTPEGVFERT